MFENVQIKICLKLKQAKTCVYLDLHEDYTVLVQPLNNEVINLPLVQLYKLSPRQYTSHKIRFLMCTVNGVHHVKLSLIVEQRLERTSCNNPWLPFKVPQPTYRSHEQPNMPTGNQQCLEIKVLLQVNTYTLYKCKHQTILNIKYPKRTY